MAAIDFYGDFADRHRRSLRLCPNLYKPEFDLTDSADGTREKDFNAKDAKRKKVLKKLINFLFFASFAIQNLFPVSPMPVRLNSGRYT